MTYAVAGPAVSTVPSTSTVAEVEQPWKRKQLTDPADRALAWESFQDWWASGRSTPSTGTSSAPRPLLVTPPIDPVPRPLSASALRAVATLSSSSLVLSHHSWQSPDHVQYQLHRLYWIQLTLVVSERVWHLQLSWFHPSLVIFEQA